MKKPIVLIIMDGWGISPEKENNAVYIAHTPNLERLSGKYPHCELGASGKSVGLPDGQMGNSEVGHLNLGAGRIVYQDFSLIDNAIETGTFFKNDELNALCKKCESNGGSLHLLGLLSDGGVHSHIRHLFATITLIRKYKIKNVYIHAFLDGRDTPPKSSHTYIQQALDYIKNDANIKLVSMSGRFYAMDRDNRWERVKKAYDALSGAVGRKSKNLVETLETCYQNNETDEFVIPTVLEDYKGFAPTDGVIFFNFRADRARELTRAFTEKDFDLFDVSNNVIDKTPINCSHPLRGGDEGVGEICNNVNKSPHPYPLPQGERKSFNRDNYICFTEYDERFHLHVAFKPMTLNRILGEEVSKHGLNQLRIAETEKYAHVTFFFSGGDENTFPKEDRALIPSPKEVATYDKKPEMSAYLVTDEVLKRIKSDVYDLIILNFANADMVGHTGILQAAVKACETVDACVGRVVDEVLRIGGEALITADHGNAEQMYDKTTKQPHTAHTTNPVPFILVSERVKKLSECGVLADIAPTIMTLLGIEQPSEMTGTSLIKEMKK